MNNTKNRLGCGLNKTKRIKLAKSQAYNLPFFLFCKSKN